MQHDVTTPARRTPWLSGSIDCAPSSQSIPAFCSGSQTGLRVTMLGIRGFPDVQGGVEKHCEKLSCSLVELGCDVQAIVRSCYTPKRRSSWRGVKLSRVWAPHIQGIEAFVHTFLGILRAARARPDVLHIHAIGPAFFAPFARALGMRVVVTYHSLNYEHKKWGRLARIVLRAGEWAGMTFSNGRIAVSDALAARMRRHYHTVVHSVPNGIDGTERVQTTKYLQSFGLSENKYVLSVARIDEEKRQLDLIAAYARLRNPSFKLALVGEADHSGHYARTVREVVRKSPGVMLLGYQTGQALAELYSHATAFVLPSSNEGQPLVVLEATSFGLPVILSDIEGHREINVPGARYFPVGNIDALKVHLADAIATPLKTSITAECVQLLSRHDWRKVAQQTLAIYLEACSEAKDAQSLSGDQGKRYGGRFRGTHLHSGH